jgi:Mu-like prophage I protein
MSEQVFKNRATFFGTPVLLYAVGEAPKEVAEHRWVHLANEGLYKGHYAGEFNLTRSTFESFVKNLRDDPQYRAGSLEFPATSADGSVKTYTGGIRPVLQYDYEHASEMPGSEGSIPAKGAPAMGWVLDLEVRNGPDGKAQLWAFTQLGDQIRGQICRNEYRWVSMAFNLKGVHWVTGLPIGPVLTSVAFTNHSFMRDLESLAAANRGASVPADRGVKPNPDPTEAPVTVTTSNEGASAMSDQFRERICRSLKIRTLVDDAAIGDAVEEATSSAGNLKSLLEALGVAKPEDALKVIPELRSAREKIAGLLSELDTLLQQDASADAAIGVADVGAAMKSMNFVGEGAQKALGAMRAQCVTEEVKKASAALKTGETLSLSAVRDARAKGRAHFLKEYNVKEGSSNVAHLGRTLVASNNGTQVEPPKSLVIEDRVAGDTIDLRGLAGVNTIEKLITHLTKAEAGFDKLPYPAKIARASSLRRTAQITQ